ncbi:MAG: autotransporter outer membrane beta-barrel domain-containing protein [Ketobacteraceae bacterium]|nr:autotransporter outer membrane beta-barrel domain-containing protein [Ketobacteraceae bacterium]
MKSTIKKGFWWSLVLPGLLGLTAPAFAGIEEVPDLTEAQTNAAIAVSNIFNELDARISSGETLSEEEQALYEGAKEIVHTGNQILNALFGDSLPTEDSLNLDAEGFAAVLQWVTHEEIGAQGKMTSEALGAQTANIGARIDALRMGSRGFQMAWHQQAYPDGSYYRGGNAGAEAGVLSKWGAFLNGGYSEGERDPTDREDAFEFDTWSVTGGVDYRLQPSLIVGAAMGVIESQVDFDGSKSIVAGEIESESWLITLFGAGEWQQFYGDASLTFGQTDFDMERRISYPSNNALIAATNELALSSTESDQLSLTVQGGYIISQGSWTYGPTFAIDYVNTEIDGYTETNADELNLTVESQDIDSLTSRLGGRVQFVANQYWGVLVPQFDLEWIHEFEDDAREIGAKFADDVTNSFFNVITDEPDSDYFLAALSVSAVLQNGVQAFFSYKTPLKLDEVDSAYFAGGARLEF